MKRILFILLTTLALLPLQAQQVVILKKTAPKATVEVVSQGGLVSVQEFPRHYLQFNIGDNFLNSRFSGSRRLTFYFPEYSVPRVNGADPYTWFPSYQGTYRSYVAIVPFTFSLQYFYAFRPWLHFGVDFYYAGEYYNYSRLGTGELLTRDCKAQMSVLPSIRFQYFNRKYVGLYSGIAAGLYMGYESAFGNRTLDLLPAFQLTWLGLRVGNRAFWTLEVGVGHKGLLTTGVGVRF